MSRPNRPRPCRCPAHPFPHRRSRWCGVAEAWAAEDADDEEYLADDAADYRRQEQAEWNADRAQDARAINRGDQ